MWKSIARHYERQQNLLWKESHGGRKLIGNMGLTEKLNGGCLEGQGNKGRRDIVESEEKNARYDDASSQARCNGQEYR